jgi:hypothetical protein
VVPHVREDVDTGARDLGEQEAGLQGPPVSARFHGQASWRELGKWAKR